MKDQLAVLEEGQHLRHSPPHGLGQESLVHAHPAQKQPDLKILHCLFAVFKASCPVHVPVARALVHI